MFFENLFEVRDDECYGISGLNKELNCIYVYDAFIKFGKGILVVTNSLYEANDMYGRLLNYTDRVLLFPMDDFITSEAVAISPEFMAERINTLNKIVENNRYIVVCNLMGYLRYLPSVDRWRKSIISLKVGEDISRDSLVERLYAIGYDKETVVVETGKMGIRGYVLDVFPVSSSLPIRIEFWGDTIDSIKYFDVDTQLSVESLDSISIYPFSEFLVDDVFDGVVRKQKYLKHYNKNVYSLGDYLDNYLCFYNDYNQILSAYYLLRESILEYDRDNEGEFKTDYMFDILDIKFKRSIYLMNIDNVLENVKLNFCDRFVCKNIDCYDSKVDLIKSDLIKFLNSGKTILLCVENSNNAKRIIDYLDLENVIFASLDDIVKNKVNFLYKSIGNGYIYDDYVVLGNNDLFGGKEKGKKYVSHFKLGTKISNLDAISVGDYVVHDAHGIGIYDELCTIKKGDVLKDYIKVSYAEGDVLYVPVEKISRLSKFAGKEGIGVKLDKLGTDKWKNKKKKVRGRLEDIAANLMKVSAEREAMKGFAFSDDDENQLLFESDFAYTETADQVKAIAAIKREMQKAKPMDMLLCGDVGYGKTEVAFRAIFKAVNDGKQVAYLCPTTILSNQQYKNALERFKRFPVNIALLNRFVDKKDQERIISAVNNGKVDILFGTHRILSKDIQFKNLGLLVVDEEQRFGVTHKERIKQYKANVDVLTLSATPIPRTLQMSMTGIRSLALIETAPAQRLPVQTYVLPVNKNVIKDAIYKELSRNGQVFLLYNHLNDINEKVKEISELVPEARVDFAHGQMEKHTLEDKMLDFIEYKFDVLVCTTIIETGIDIPNVNTLIIIDADRFGLAQLYQIRGRIGRSNRIGYAYLMYDNRKVLNDLAVKRLNTIKEFTELGSGFKIAMRDLSIRGAGDILGSEQSGFIDTIGIDLYLRMLREAVDKLKYGTDLVVNDEIDDEKDSKPLVEIDTHISDDYINDDELKIEIHKKINEVDSLERFMAVKTELEDRFGKITKEMEIYMYEEWFEKLASVVEVVKVKQTKASVSVELSSKISSKIDGEKLFMLAYDICKYFRFLYKDGCIQVILDTVKLEEHFLIYFVGLFEKIKEMVVG